MTKPTDTGLTVEWPEWWVLTANSDGLVWCPLQSVGRNSPIYRWEPRWYPVEQQAKPLPDDAGLVERLRDEDLLMSATPHQLHDLVNEAATALETAEREKAEIWEAAAGIAAIWSLDAEAALLARATYEFTQEDRIDTKRDQE